MRGLRWLSCVHFINYIYLFSYLLPHSLLYCGRFCFFLIPSVCGDFFVCVWSILGNPWTDLRQIPTEDVFGPLLGQLWRLRSKVNVTRDKMAFFGPSAACMWFMFGKTSLASSLLLASKPRFTSCSYLLPTGLPLQTRTKDFEPGPFGSTVSAVGSFCSVMILRGRLSWLPISFWPHVNVLHHIVWLHYITLH